MADKRISQLVDRGTIENNDVVPIVVSGATTTNKATISSIQTFMQDNLDVGVTSVGITLGTTGTDVNVTGSPITTSGNITINIPNASATARGVVTTGTQTFAGIKYFNDTIVANDDIQLVQQGTALPTFIKNISGTFLTAIGSNGIGFNGSNNIYFAGSNKNGGVIAFNNTANQIYTLQDASGTLAFTSQLDGYVTLDTAQTITAQKTFTTSGGSDTLIVDHTSGGGIALDISKAGDGEGLRVTKTSGSGNAVTITGGLLSAEAGTFSGDLQSNTRVAASTGGDSIIITPNLGSTNRIEAIGSLPLALVSAHPSITMAAGGTTPQFTLGSSGLVTLTGALNGTSANFSNNIQIGPNDNGYLFITNAAGNNAGTIRTSRAYTGGVGSFNDLAIASFGVINFFTNNSTTPSATLASTGAATFSSSVTAASLSGAFATLSNYGSATSTALQLGDANNGLFRPALNSVAIATNGAAALTLASTGAATFSSSVNLGANANSADTASLNIKQAGTSYNQGIYIERGGERNGYHMYIGGALDSLTFRRNYFGTQSDVMSLTRDGNVGIGTASPYSRLEVADVSRLTNAGQWASATISMKQVGGFIGDFSQIVFGYHANTQTNASAYIGYVATNQGANGFGDLVFGTRAVNTDTQPTERLRITSGGQMRVGASDINSSAISAFVSGFNGIGSKVSNNAFYLFSGLNTSDATTFFVLGNGDVRNTNNSYGAISDIKLKENIEDASPKLDDLLKVKVRNYNLIGDDKKQIGVIAQELEEVFPLMVDELEDFEEVEVPQLDEEGNEILNEEGEVVTEKQRVSKGTTTKSVKYSVFVPMLIKAIQELKTEIDSLKNQIK